MKRTTRIAIAGIGLTLFGLTGCICAILAPWEHEAKSRDFNPVRYTIKAEPIVESKSESAEPQYIHVEPQIVEQESEVEIEETEPALEYYVSPINLTEDERWVVQCMVAGEAGGESYEGKKAVAQCIFDGMLKNEWTARQVRDNYQYSGWNECLENQNREMYIEVVDAVHDIFDLGQFVTDRPILYFYNPNIIYSSWHESLNLGIEIGNHRLFYLSEDVNAEWTNILLTNVNEYGIIEQ